ncbi:neural cell adhesion molecule 1-like [Haliotis cracherodii]|uniref:neural cell adhesion molecule 1-like n=1 Tax=Haliotis cracherodii TaxID=6455 RepID=UPI0039E96E24
MKLVCFPAVVLVVAVIGLNTGAVFLSEDSPWTITAGTNASVTCEYQNITNYTVYWEKEEHSTVTPGNETLLFKNVQVTDHGQYSCVIEANDTVLEKRTLDIRVSYPPGNISISVSNRVRANYTIPGGANATLVCSVDGFPPPFITWQKDGDILKEENLTDRYGLHQPPNDVFISVFDVINAGREDSGTYVCTANNSANQNDSPEAEVHLAVPTYPPGNISISVNNRVSANYTIPGGANATLVCSVDGFPPPFITWRKDGAIIKEENLTDRYGLRQPPTDGFISVFDVINAGREDSGTYVCTAHNSANHNDSPEAEVHLAVPTYPPGNISISVNNGFRANYTIPGGANATLECSVDGFPPPFITWRKDGDIIKEETLTDRYGLRQPPTDGFISVFDVINAGREDSGTYVCTANNSANQNDTQEAEVHLAVPKYFPVLQNQGELSRSFTVAEGESIEVNFTVVSSPRSLVAGWSLQANGSNETSVWSRSGDNSLWNMGNRILSADVQLFQFYHVNITENMTGLYRVMLTNGLRRNLDLEYSIGIGYDTTARSINTTDVYNDTTVLNLKDDEDYESTWKILLAVVVGVVVTNVLLVVLLSFCIRAFPRSLRSHPSVEAIFSELDDSMATIKYPVTGNAGTLHPIAPQYSFRGANDVTEC